MQSANKVLVGFDRNLLLNGSSNAPLDLIGCRLQQRFAIGNSPESDVLLCRAS